MKKNKWTLLKAYNKILKLKGGTMVQYKDKLVLFGGCSIDLECSNTLFVFDIK